MRVKEKAFFSDKVDVPLLSFGKMIKSGWGIQSTGLHSSPVLAHTTGACVELGFRNNSLVIEGDIRMIQNVRAVSVDIPRTWQNLQAGWYEIVVRLHSAVQAHGTLSMSQQITWLLIGLFVQQWHIMISGVGK